MENCYKIFDSHAHYDDDAFEEDRDKVVAELISDGVIGVLNCASSYESILKTDEITKKYSMFFGALGIHPENAYELNDEVIDEIKEYVSRNNKIVAIGEIGLDYYWDENPS